MMPMPKILTRHVVYEQPPTYLGWPSLAREADGGLLCVFSGNRESHVCPYGKILLLGSRDGGVTWGEEAMTVASTPLDDRDPGLVVLPNGDWLLTWFALDTGKRLRAYRQFYPAQAESWARHLSKIPAADRYTWHDHWSQRSSDRGATWTAPVRSRVSAPHGPMLCPDGRLVYLGTARGQALLAVESRDGGGSWEAIGTLIHAGVDAKAAPSALSEAHGVALSDTELIGWWRQEFTKQTLRDPVLHCCRSHDGGATWTTPQPTTILGFPPHALRLADGRVLLSYGYRQKPYGVRARVFDPEAFEAYSLEYVLANDGGSWDLGYPATVELEPGDFYTVYYEADAWDCGTIHGIHWRLED